MASENWTEAQCLHLIREFRKRPILWDQKSPLFYKKALKPDAWVEIGEELNISAEQCRHKMVILMSSFRREKAKYMNNLKYPKYPYMPYQSTWFAFNEMSFLMDKDRERKRKLTEFLAYDDEDSDTNTDEDKTSTTTTEQHPVESIRWVVRPSLDSDEQASSMKFPKTSARDDQALQFIPPSEERQNPTTSQPNDDEIKYFSNFIASKMMKYSEKTKNAVQQAICQIIFKADQQCYEQMQEPNIISAKSQEHSKQPSSGTDQPGESDIISIKLHYSDSE